MIDFKPKEKYNYQDLLRIMEILRSDNGCPWDKEQTHKSIRRNFIEEVYEAAEAIDDEDDVLLAEELGDVLLQIVFHANIAKDRGAFDIGDVEDGICKKLIKRHPHIFGENRPNISNASEVLESWESIKNKEKQTSFPMTLDAVAKSLPSLIYAEKLITRTMRGGGELRSTEAGAKRIEKLLKTLADDQNRQSEIIGEILFETVLLANLKGVESEEALKGAALNFIDDMKDLRKEQIPSKQPETK